MRKMAARKTVPKETTTVDAEKAKAFDEAIAGIAKKYKSDTGRIIGKLSDKPIEIERFSSGSVVLDSIIGGGFPRGRIIELYGPESSGKTSFALTAAGNVQKKGGTAVLVDMENSFDPVYAKRLGVDTKNLAVSQPDYAEQALQIVADLVMSGAVDLIVVDSVASLVPKKEVDGEMDDQTIGLQARLMSHALRKLTPLANKTQTTIIFINQTRQSIGMFATETVPGGNALKFYASLRVRISKSSKPVLADGTPIGTNVFLTCKKNKVSVPFMEGQTLLTFKHGVDKALELLECGLRYGIIEREGNTRYIEKATGEIITTKSRAEAISEIRKNPEMMARLADALTQRLNEIAFGDEVDEKEDAPAATEDSFVIDDSGDTEVTLDE